jgi:hypothetical protein
MLEMLIVGAILVGIVARFGWFAWYQRWPCAPTAQARWYTLRTNQLAVTLLLISTIFASTYYSNPLTLRDAYAQIVGQKYYFSINGNDSNNGTSSSTAWKSINKVTFGIDGTSSDTYGFYSRNDSTTSQRPQLVVVYQ